MTDTTPATVQDTTPAVHGGGFTIQDMWAMSQAFAKSGMFGVKTPEQAMSLLLIAQADGTHPAQAMREYNVIQGKPSLNADAMLARHQRSGGTVEWLTYTDETVTGKFAYQKAEVTITWDTAKAQAVGGLLNKDNWRKFPAAMRRARCISEGVRTVNPGCIMGLYVPDEVEEFASNPRTIVDECREVGDLQTMPIEKPREEPRAERKPKLTNVSQQVRDMPKVDELQPPVGLDEAARAFGDTREMVNIVGIYNQNRDGEAYIDKKGDPYTSVKVVCSAGEVYANVWKVALDWKNDKGEWLARLESKADSKGKMWYALHDMERPADPAAGYEPQWVQPVEYADVDDLDDFGPPLDLDEPLTPGD